jgi:hypothetical protein
MAVNANAKVGFYTALGVLAGLFVWNFVSSKIPSFRSIG